VWHGCLLSTWCPSACHCSPPPQLHHLTLKTTVRALATLTELATCPCNCCQGRSSLQRSWEEAVLAHGCLPKSKAALAYTCKIRQDVAHQIAARGPVWAVIYRDCLCTIQPYFAAWVRHVWPLLQQSHMRDGRMHALHDGSKCCSAVCPSVVPWQGQAGDAIAQTSLARRIAKNAVVPSHISPRTSA